MVTKSPPQATAKSAAKPRAKPFAKSTPEEEAATAKIPRRVIKKYPNRRLYDTDSSAYITLTEVKQLVVQAKPFVVRDAKTNEDLTRSILLQIILEEESGGVPMFSEAVLANIIRFYGNTMQGFMGSYLEKNVQTFSDMQSKMTEQGKAFASIAAPGLGAMPPIAAMPGAMGAYIEQSKSVFAQMQEQMHKQTEQMFSAFGLKR